MEAYSTRLRFGYVPDCQDRWKCKAVGGGVRVVLCQKAEVEVKFNIKWGQTRCGTCVV